ncbi:hypothetical protein [Rhodopila sp.]|uniref:hypothetical protein n=1 Tax=Rhodopila sp. TaxID=2480087 RepID=UPI002D7E38CD|nr:hypothetical protein [Rhodopila sp.]
MQTLARTLGPTLARAWAPTPARALGRGRRVGARGGPGAPLAASLLGTLLLGASLLGASLLGGCVTISVPPLPTPVLPPMVWGIYLDNDVGGISFAAWAFASPANTRGNPVDAARAIVAVEYLAGELDSPRWVSVDATSKARLRQAREAVRQVVGIRADAPPQVVVNALLAFVQDVPNGAASAAAVTLTPPLFERGPQATLDTLSNLPFIPQANEATARVAAELLAGGPGR